MNILIGLDSEKYTHSPVIIGKIIAKATEADVSVLIIVTKDGHLENAEAVADQARIDLEGITPEILVRSGNLSDLYEQELLTKNYQLVIVDAARKRLTRKFNDIDPILTRQSSFAILLTENAKPKLDRILLASSCKEDDFSLVRKAAGFAGPVGATVTLLHVISGAVPTMYTGLNQLDETVEEMLQTDTPFAKHLRHAGEILHEHEVESEVKIRRGVPVEEIVRETQLENYDLVIIGTSEVKEGIKARMLGNLVVKIIDLVELPVMVIGHQSLL
jgi:nucleotide-binding universal stress UspA family protein